jgi:hypothetical protein
VHHIDFSQLQAQQDPSLILERPLLRVPVPEQCFSAAGQDHLSDNRFFDLALCNRPGCSPAAVVRINLGRRVMPTITIFIGAIAMASLVISLFFLRFWKTTRDRFFLFFSASFFLEAANRVLTGISVLQNEESPMYYLIRLIAYSLIIIAIIDKNSARNK